MSRFVVCVIFYKSACALSHFTGCSSILSVSCAPQSLAYSIRLIWMLRSRKYCRLCACSAFFVQRQCSFDWCSVMMCLSGVCSPESRGRPRVHQGGNCLERSRWERVLPKTPKPFSRSVHTRFTLRADVNQNQEAGRWCNKTFVCVCLGLFVF